jgi:hypothetical protein
MKSHRLPKALFAMVLLAGTVNCLFSQNPIDSARANCVVTVSGLQSNCPAGWQIVEETARGTTIGNFARPDRSANLTIPAGKATIGFHPKPVTYQNFKEWVYSATKVAPDAIQSSKNMANKTVGSISVICFTSPDSQRGLIYESYFFEINGTPVNLELNYQRTSQSASEYRAVLDKLVENIEASRH